MTIKCVYSGKDLNTGAQLCFKCGMIGSCEYFLDEDKCSDYKADDSLCKKCKSYVDGKCRNNGCGI